MNNQNFYHKPTDYQKVIQEVRKMHELTYDALSKMTGIAAQKLFDLEYGPQDGILTCDEHITLCTKLWLDPFEMVQRLNESPPRKIFLYLPSLPVATELVREL